METNMKNMIKVLVLSLTSLMPICGDVSAMQTRTHTQSAQSASGSVLNMTFVNSQANMGNQRQTLNQTVANRMMSYANVVTNFVSRSWNWLGLKVRQATNAIRAYYEEFQAENSTGITSLGHTANAVRYRVASEGYGVAADLNRPF